MGTGTGLTLKGFGTIDPADVDMALFMEWLAKMGEAAVVAIGISGTVALDLSVGSVFRHTLVGNVTYTFINPPAAGRAGSFTLIIEQPAAAKTLTFPSSVKWAGDTTPTAPGNSLVAIYVFVTTDGGTRWYGMQAGSGFVI